MDDVFSRIKQCKYPSYPISDFNSTFGFNRWNKKCKEAGVSPAFGVELEVVEALGEKKPLSNRWTFFAISDISALNNLVSIATGNPGKLPSLTYSQATSAKGLIKIAGNLTPEEVIEKNAKKKDFYVGLSPSTPKAIAKMWKKHKAKMIACSDNSYSVEKDRELYRMTLFKDASTQSYPQHILTSSEWKQSTKFICTKTDQANAIRNRNSALKRCKAVMKEAKLLVPEKSATLNTLCRRGAKELGVNLKDKVYKERLNYELGLIHEKNFEDYFYIIADLVAFAKKRMVVGPARGSSCGSLVCYLLGITTIDPIPYGLIFERFIDINRLDLPDIDIDFSDKRRHLVFEYAEDKYGAERVARLGTVSLFKPRSSLKEIGKALEAPMWLIEKTLDGLIDRSSGDSRALQALEDTLKETENGQRLLKEFPEIIIAGELEGHPHNASQHAAGIVVTDQPVNEIVAVDLRTKSAMCDKKDAEDLNLLKIDALGLRQLSIFERTMDLLGVDSISGWLEKIPLDDQKAFDVLNNGHYSGIFQFNGSALQGLSKMIKFTHLEDMISITALARPGPLITGGANAWVKRKMGKEDVKTLHPKLMESTKDTYGIIIYQEQVMNIARNIGLLSWEDTSTLRKAMSKSLGDEFFSKFWLKFKKGALKNGIDEVTAKTIWDQINSFGSWAFNRSHAVAYGVISYWCCWLKANHPLEFAAATLDAQSDPHQQIIMLRELKAEGIDYLPYDLDTSTTNWEITKRDGKDFLVGPLNNIKGVGPAAEKEIMFARENGAEIRPALQKRISNSTTAIDTLYPISDAINTMYPDLKKDANITTEVKPVIDVQAGKQKEVLVIGIITKIAPLCENELQRVQKRIDRNGGHGKLFGPTKALNLWITDDTDEVYCKVNRFDFQRLGLPIITQGKAGKSLYAIKGKVPNDFRMITIDRVKYLGNIDDAKNTDK